MSLYIIIILLCSHTLLSMNNDYSTKTNDLIIITASVTTVWQSIPNDQALFNYNNPSSIQEMPSIETQLLLHEFAQVLAVEDNWLYIKTINLQYFNSHSQSWQPHVGWIFKQHAQPQRPHWTFNSVIHEPFESRATDIENSNIWLNLSMGTMLYAYNNTPPFTTIDILNHAYVTHQENLMSIIDTPNKTSADIRSEIVLQAHKYHIHIQIQSPDNQYTHKGRSSYDKNNQTTLTGTDNGGLIHLLYRSCGIHIPHDPHSQLIAATPINIDQIQPGDLLFITTANTNFKHAERVFMNLGGTLYIEANAESSKVEIMHFSEIFIYNNNDDVYSRGSFYLPFSFNGQMIQLKAGSFLYFEENIPYFSLINSFISSIMHAQATINK